MIILQLKNNLKKKRKDRDFPDGPVAKNPPSDAGHTGSNLFGKLRAHMQWAKSLCYNQREDPARHQRSCLPQLRLNTAKINIIQYLKKRGRDTRNVHAQGKDHTRMQREDLSSVSQGGRPQEKPNLPAP